MILSIHQLQAKVGEVYPDVTQVGETVLRFTKRAADSAFAVCYLDVTKHLPSNRQEVAEYVERVVGPTYFDQPKSLQWNHYLYFVVDSVADKAVRQSKTIIEQDPTYARKFVIEEDGVDALLKPSLVQATRSANRVDAISRWIDALSHPHLIEAVFGNHTRAERLTIADGTKAAPLSKRTPAGPASNKTSTLPPLRRFHIETFRPCLNGEEFDFQDVNLLFGVNGAGKTSALEAIELYYCGKHTKRNQDTVEKYRFHVSVEGSGSESVSHNSRAVGIFRDRNRDWYGVREQRRSHLYDSFGRFNFLNTDAAVDLATSADGSIESDLARLLVGSDAAVIWPVIEQLAGDVTAELRRANEARTQWRDELLQIQKQLAESSTVKTESDSLRATLRDALKRNQWSVDDHDFEGEAGGLAERLSELLSIAQQAVELPWIDAPVTLDRCQRFAGTVREFIEAKSASVQNLESLAARQAELATATTRTQQAATLAAELGRLIDAGVERRASDVAAQRRFITSASSLLAGIDEETLTAVAKTDTNRPLAEGHAAATKSREQAKVAADDARRKSEEFASVRQRSVALAQQLRQLAGQIITAQTADQCPLCHTKFEPGELERHMALGVDEHVEAAAQKLLANVTRLDAEYRQAATTETALANIVRYCLAARFSTGATIATALAKISETQTALTAARERVEVLSFEIRSLQAQGISLDRLNVVRIQLNALGFGGAHQSSDEVDALQRSVQENVRVASEEAKSTARAITRLQESLDAAFRPWQVKVTDPRRTLALLEERRVRTQEIVSRLAQFTSWLPWPSSRPVGEWIIEVESVRGIAVKLQTALGRERVAATTLSETTRRRDQLRVLGKQLDSRVGRLNDANTVLQTVVRDHSQEALTRSAMQDNRKAIETIFSQIHSPAEFESIEIKNDRWELKRKVGDQGVKLTQISTGQRAAFALSVFLAQNAQLTAGPPAILIDDPIAHIDDLNCLSFLDYLREIALTRQRQIFFATASAKLASLFERKFDFLGSRFRRFNLPRIARA